MAARVQIVYRAKGESRWKFRAHGASFERKEAQGIKRFREGLGDIVRLLPMGKESNND